MARSRRRTEDDEDSGMDWGRNRLSNTDMVERIMSYGSPMKQLVVMTAIEKYAQMCIEAGPRTFDSGLLNGDAWVHACKEILRELAEMRAR